MLPKSAFLLKQPQRCCSAFCDPKMNRAIKITTTVVVAAAQIVMMKENFKCIMNNNETP